MNDLNKQFFKLNNFKELTVVQERVLKEIKHRRDLIVKSDTGTGKTHAFLFAILELIDPEVQQTQAIILAPTRELAMQIDRFAKEIQKVDSRITIDLAIGGMDQTRLKKKLERQPQILIATPGKMKDVMNDNIIRLDFVKTCVVDETDMMLDYGFIDEVDSIASRLLDNTVFMLYSATIPVGLKAFIKKYLTRPIEINGTNEQALKPRIEHILINQRHRSSGEAVLDVLSHINPLLALVFSNTKHEAVEIAAYLRSYGIDCVEIHGDVSDRGRKQVLNQINAKKVRYIVATDLAARGIDLPEISHVINVGLPSHDLSFYTHRAGRTGRSGREGLAISIVSASDQSSVSRLMKQGIHFQYKRFKDGGLEEVRPFLNIAKRRERELDSELGQILNRKKIVVKPGYKKARKHKVEQMMNRRRRELIRTEIREQKRARAKAKQQENKD